MKKKLSIIYVNFSPYDNAGRILDYLISHFPLIIHFSYDHLRLKNGRKTNILTVYRNGKAVKSQTLIPIRTPEFLRFPSLPLVAFLIFIQTYWYSKKILHGKEADYYLSVNAYTSWIGNFLRDRHIVKKTIFWIWDYFPPGYPDIRIQFLRWMYWKFDKPSLTKTDIITCINRNLIKLRLDMKVLDPRRKYTIIPIGTNPIQSIPTRPVPILGFLGMLKSSQGLNFIFDSLSAIHTKFPHIHFEIIGSGPEEAQFINRGKNWKKFVTFYGFIESENKVDEIIKRWSIGLATYVPVQSNESYWTDPSKIKAYVSQGVPVITTDVPSFAKDIEKYDAGIIIPYGDTEKFLCAIETILSKKVYYAQNAKRLANKYIYKRVYRSFFSHENKQ